jgi:ferredoxin
MHQAQLGVIDFASEDIWLCTTCGQCTASCPRGVDIATVMRGLRTIAWEQRSVEKGLPSLLWSIYWNNNPWSQPLFDNPRIRQVIGDCCEVIEGFPSGYFACLLHDPPAFSLAGEMYSLEFYRQAYRVLKSNGRMFHYIGNPQSKSGASLTRGATQRLRQALQPHNLMEVVDLIGLSFSVSQSVLIRNPNFFHMEVSKRDHLQPHLVDAMGLHPIPKRSKIDPAKLRILVEHAMLALHEHVTCLCGAIRAGYRRVKYPSDGS